MAAAPAANQNPEVRADTAGRFTLQLPRRGSWRVTAAARGFRTQAYDEHEGYFSSVVLTDAAPTYDLTFQLTPDSTISGLVLDEAGEPVLNAQVIAELVPPLAPGESRASPAARPSQVANAQTDDRGRYELAGLQDGEYYVKVQAQPWYAVGARGGNRMGIVNLAGGAAAGSGSAPGQLDPSLDVVYPITWFPGADSAQAAETIKLIGGEQRQADFHLTAIPALHLVVTRPDEPAPVPVGGPGTNVRRDQPPQRGISITRVSSDGQYGQISFIGGNGRDSDFGGLSPGTYEVRVPGPNGDADAEVRQVELRPGATGLITMDGSKPLTRITIALDAAEGDGAAVEFFDTDSGRRILASRPPRGRRGRGGDETDATDDEQPRAMTAMLPPSMYEVSVAGGAGYITGLSATGAKVVGHTVVIGESPAALAVQVGSGRGDVSGFAKINGAPESGAMVLLVPATLGQPGDATPVMRDQSNTDGSFELSGVIPGRYILVAIDHGWRVDWRKPDILARFLAQGVPVEVKASAKLKEEITGVLP